MKNRIKLDHVMEVVRELADDLDALSKSDDEIQIKRALIQYSRQLNQMEFEYHLDKKTGSNE